MIVYTFTTQHEKNGRICALAKRVIDKITLLPKKNKCKKINIPSICIQRVKMVHTLRKPLIFCRCCQCVSSLGKEQVSVQGTQIIGFEQHSAANKQGTGKQEDGFA